METEIVTGKALWKRLAVLAAIIIVIAGFWAFFQFKPNSLGLGGNTSYGLLRGEFENGKDYSSAVGYYVPPFRLKGTDGSVVDFEKDILGKKTMLVFEATWCTFCKQEKNDLNRISKEGKVNFVVIDINESEELVKDHLSQYGINHPWYLDPGGQVSTWFLLAGTPTHLFIDEEGKIVRRDTGYRTGQELDEAIDELLAS